jgi:hypothetical protein
MGSTCDQPLSPAYDTVFAPDMQVPGLFSCLCIALEEDPANDPSLGAASFLGDVAPLGWLALNTALNVPGARQDELISRMANALSNSGGAAAKAAAQIRVLLAPAQAAANAASDMDVDSAPAGAETSPAVVAVEDLWQTAGGRHSNDKQDFRDVQVMVTSDEVRHTYLQLQAICCYELSCLHDH